MHLGDDTWHSLFPGYLDKDLSRPYPSLDVWDLHTVDNGVEEHLFPLLHPQNSSAWDFLIGHGLGVDHAGHEYNPDHPQMAAKLHQMNGLVERVIPWIDDDTLLVVMGDHGMDTYGNHGGESDDEVQAALWMYSKQPFFGHTNGKVSSPPATAKERSVAQIDLVPTLSLLLGLPIPFNNLGTPIAEAFLGVEGTDFATLATASRLAASQVSQYQHEYSQVRSLDDAATSESRQLFAAASVQWSSLHNMNMTILRDQWKDVAKSFRAYQQENLSLCRDLWARFNMVSMIEGIAILATTVIIIAVYARSIGPHTPDRNAALFVRGLLGLLIGGLSGSLLGSIVPAVGLLRSSCFLAAMTSCIFIAANFWTTRGTLLSVIPCSIAGWMCLICIVLLSASFGSNSYTVGEEDSLLFFLSGFGILTLAASLGLGDEQDRLLGAFHSILFMLLIRLSSLSQLCREEQMPLCKSSFYPPATSAVTWQLVIPFANAIVLPTMFKAHFTRTQSWHGSAPFWIGIAFRMSLFLIAVYWTLDAADSGDWLSNFAAGGLVTSVKTNIAQLVLMVAAGAGTATFVFQAPLIAMETSASGVASHEKSIAKLDGTSTHSPLIIHGATNIYGSHYAVLPFTVVLIPLLLLQRPMGQAALALISLAIFLSLIHI